jgi:hypothetical protein
VATKEAINVRIEVADACTRCVISLLRVGVYLQLPRRVQRSLVCHVVVVTFALMPCLLAPVTDTRSAPASTLLFDEYNESTNWEQIARVLSQAGVLLAHPLPSLRSSSYELDVETALADAGLASFCSLTTTRARYSLLVRLVCGERASCVHVPIRMTAHVNGRPHSMRCT